jgi:hypothetical protein
MKKNRAPQRQRSQATPRGDLHRSADPVVVEAIGHALRARLDEDVHVALPERIAKLLRALESTDRDVPPRRSRRSWSDTP